MGNELSDLKNKAKSDASRNRPDGEAVKSAEETDQTGRSFNLFARRLSCLSTVIVSNTTSHGRRSE